MFYEKENVDPYLRFGDIIEGFQLLQPIYNDFLKDKYNFEIEVRSVNFFVVTTPCCSIERSKLSVAPLKSVRNVFYNNDYFIEDLTRINRLMSPEKSVPKESWKKMPEARKQEMQGVGYSFAFMDLFIYDSNDLLPQYELNTKQGKIETGYYMLDFKDIFVFDSNIVNRGKNIPKILQLSKNSRDDLRNKLAKYFNRVPEEDIV